MNKLLCMVELQQKLNDATNGLGWEKGLTKEGKSINWRRCITMESAEMIDSFGWKHWKSIAQPTDYANLQIEIVDVWHFVMSLLLEFTHNNGAESIGELAERMSKTPEYQRLNTATSLEFGSDPLLMTKIENVMRLSLIPVSAEMVGALIEEFFELAYLGALNTTELYRLYVGKNILNQFRQDHGYKEGSYIKLWNGLEDNVVMKRAWETNPDMTPEELYDALKAAYPA
ncbi:MAG: dUTPase [Sulfuricurvum sp. GWF2_44_89]|uniref:dUTPase n=1 Tax=Sulfuricurvum kujiense TaxID=148813 RepID=A0A2D3WR19_9BACT|nr:MULTISPECIES: dUTP diphosphatase [Sulfuricurvum]OHD79262.1 MAG: dUTPase [Sulfuricurvum sp. GWF2_44_89]OHD93725.1 MAG: dUTPase [Sulfuricurvum sp. RIFOXYD12_FULL_44_77]OHD98114.1 MAG: dUTPase [Sulfuricurvum sp. RIFOXYD2_FULL_44_160]DAB39163.1 MAG TPA: dUTPase [Sulfuricurvum kujiense]